MEFLDFIPSKDVRDLILETNKVFSDFEQATIIYNADSLYSEKIAALKQILRSTKDERLKTQLTERLTRDERQIELFKDEAAGFFYAVNSHKYGEGDQAYICGYFSSFEAALAHGEKQLAPFEIEKFQLMGASDALPIVEKIAVNPYWFTADSEESSSEQAEAQAYDGSPVASLSYSKAGDLLRFYSLVGHSDEEKENEFTFSPKRFENAFVYDFPYPFDKGDIVRSIPDGGYGLVGRSKQDWRAYNDRMKLPKWSSSADYFDVGTTVDFLFEGATPLIQHGHIQPMYLEKYEPTDEDPGKDLLLAGSALLKGEGSLECFARAYEDYQELAGKAAKKKS